jgi:glucose-1-phosphate cytidylyltransferase
MLTYGDGVCDIDINHLIDYHKKHGKYVTITSIRMPGRFGTITTNDASEVIDFKEKQDGDDLWINGGFSVLDPAIFKYLEGDMEQVQWEKKPLVDIAKDGQLVAYKHEGFGNVWMPCGIK